MSEGFLLYQDNEIMDMVNVKVFPWMSQAVAKVRRMKRPGYRDPGYKDLWHMEGYLEDRAWANYVKENSWLYEEKNVEGKVNEEVCRNEGILVQPGMDVGVQETLEWALETSCEALTVQDG